MFDMSMGVRIAVVVAGFIPVVCWLIYYTFFDE